MGAHLESHREIWERWKMFSIGRSAFRAGILLGACLALSSTAHSASVYDFESLTAGSSLVGQDNWQTASGPLLVTAGTGADTTKVAQAEVNTTSQMTRVNDANFAFEHLTGSETSATLQFDVQIGGRNTSAGWSADFALGHNYGSSGGLGVFFGVEGGSLLPPNGPGGDFFDLEGADISHTAALPASVHAGDWLHLVETVDFTANGGDASGSLSYSNLTLGTPLTAIAGLQNINLKLSINGASFRSPATWDEMFIREDGANGVLPAVDNLSVSATAVPIPSAAWGGLWLLGIMFGWKLISLRRLQAIA